jgi:hypothetical protein
MNNSEKERMRDWRIDAKGESTLRGRACSFYPWNAWDEFGKLIDSVFARDSQEAWDKFEAMGYSNFTVDLKR